ncbi:MAG: enoyl-CoA hydratase [Actinomycetia bacterium]|nr:enoyl-CoA hydratase [Actinomycetes bacterium]MCP4083794.1 enoyl-CoA hydratase [Actinomycetes bacterium]
MTDELLFEKSEGVATITLNRPEKLNAFHDGMLASWASALVECQADDAVAAVVLTGAGRAFCAGGDVASLGVYENNPALEIGDYLRTNVHPVGRAVHSLQKPYLCAVNGAATGAGMDMALMADIRWAGHRAKFAESYIKLGLVPGDGGGWLLPRLVGMSRALELLWTGDMIDAVEAERIGIVSRVCDDDTLVGELQEFAARLAAGPTVAIRLMKQVVRLSEGQDLPGALDLVTGPMGVASNTADHLEACAAFLEKRPAVFKGD